MGLNSKRLACNKGEIRKMSKHVPTRRKFGSYWRQPKGTRRYCLACKKMTTFIMERNICHSVCKGCGGRLAYRNDPNKEKK